MAQLMPLPLTVSCFSKIQIGFTLVVLAHPGSPGQRAAKRASACVCVCKPSGAGAYWFLADVEFVPDSVGGDAEKLLSLRVVHQ